MHTAEQDGEQGEDHFAGTMRRASYRVLKTVVITRVDHFVRHSGA